jgi:phage/plasmid-like protein (TIGR03299 family)
MTTVLLLLNDGSQERNTVMPHDIAMKDGKPMMMFVGEKPWHKLGTRMTSPPKTAAEAIKAASLDWKVSLKPVYAFDGGSCCAVPGHFATVRADLWGKPECEPFGLVGEEYSILQNREAFSFFDPVIATGHVTYETAGALGRGERVWMLAKVKGFITIKGEDTVERYLLLSNGHDGRTALKIRFTPVRVVCQNTLNYALASGRDLLRSHHGRGMDRRIADAQGAVGVILKQYDSLAQHYRRFAEVKMTTERVGRYMGDVFPLPKRRVNQGDRSYQNAISLTNDLRLTSTRLFEEGRGNKLAGIRGTLWAAYNGVTELVDHHLAYRNAEQRMESVCFGDGEDTKSRAFNVALQFSRN